MNVQKHISLYESDLLIDKNTLVLAIGNENTVKQAITRKQIIAVKRGWYSYDSLGKWEARFLESLGFSSKEELVLHLKTVGTKSPIETYTEQLPEKWAFYYDSKDEHYYKKKLATSHLLDIGRKAKGMAIGMAIMRFIHDNKNKAEIKKNTGFATREELMKAIAKVLSTMELYGVPTSYDRLRIKYYDYTKAIAGITKSDYRDIMVPGNIGNTNPLKYGDEHRSVFLEYYLHPQKYSIETSYDNYCHIIQKELGLLPMSMSRAKQIALENEVRTLASLSRLGKSYYEVHVRPHVLGKSPQYSFSLVAGDGLVLGTRVKYLFNDKKTGQSTYRVGLMSTWIWYDTATGAILSYDISINEDSAQVRNSFRHIIALHGQAPVSVMIDKKYEKDHDLQVMFGRLGVKTQPKRAYNPKANPAERFNKEINAIHRELDEKWINRSPGVKSKNLHNDDLQKGTPTMDEMDFRALVKDIVNIWNNEAVAEYKGLSRLEKAKEIANPDAVQPDYFQMIEAFAQTTIVTVRNGWFKFSIAGKTYEYEVPDWIGFTMKNIKNNRVRVYYDEKFMEQVEIYAFENENELENDRHLYSCKPVARINKAQVEMTKEDWENFHHQHERAKQTDKELKDKIAERKKRLEDLSLDAHTIKGASQARHKEAIASAGAHLYDSYYEDLEHEAGRRVPEKVEVKSSKMSIDEKYKKLKNIRFDD